MFQIVSNFVLSAGKGCFLFQHDTLNQVSLFVEQLDLLPQRLDINPNQTLL